jgi:hypothetical protein
MLKYILRRFENNREVTVMETDSLLSARKQGEEFKDGYAIYETKLVEYSY